MSLNEKIDNMQVETSRLRKIQHDRAEEVRVKILPEIQSLLEEKYEIEMNLEYSNVFKAVNELAKYISWMIADDSLDETKLRTK